jgi:hypothetical protein
LEHANACMEQYLWIYGNTEQDNWVHLLPLAQYVHNSWTNVSTGYTPFELLIRHMPTIMVMHETTNVPEVACCKEWLEHARQHTQVAIKAAQNVLVTQGQHKKGQRHYKGHAVGNHVWLEGTNLKLSHPKAKLDAKRYGPFKVIEEILPVIFWLELLSRFFLTVLYDWTGLLAYQYLPYIADTIL